MAPAAASPRAPRAATKKQSTTHPRQTKDAAASNTRRLASTTTASSLPDTSMDTSLDRSTASAVTHQNILAPPPGSSRCSSFTLGGSETCAGSPDHHKLAPDSPPDVPQPLTSTYTDNVSPAALRPLWPNLEWACANSAARRKHGFFVYRDEDDSAGESSEYETELADTTGRRRTRTTGHCMDGIHDLRPSKRRRTHSVQLREIAMPREYRAMFAPDVVLGAELLLTLKHSSDIL